MYWFLTKIYLTNRIKALECNHTISEVISVIGSRLKELRRGRKTRQEDLAYVIGVQKSAVSRYESDMDDPSDKIKVEIAKYFSISLDYLLGVIDEPVQYFDKDMFIKLPQDMTAEDKELLSGFVDFLEYRQMLRNAK